MAVPKDSSEWSHVQAKLTNSLRGAKLTRLERVQNTYTWKRFYQHVESKRKVDGAGHMDFTKPDSSILKELWHASGAIDAICESKIG